MKSLKYQIETVAKTSSKSVSPFEHVRRPPSRNTAGRFTLPLVRIRRAVVPPLPPLLAHQRRAGGRGLVNDVHRNLVRLLHPVLPPLHVESNRRPGFDEQLRVVHVNDPFVARDPEGAVVARIFGDGEPGRVLGQLGGGLGDPGVGGGRPAKRVPGTS